MYTVNCCEIFPLHSKTNFWYIRPHKTPIPFEEHGEKTPKQNKYTVTVYFTLPGMRGSTPLDVAAASCIDNNELALALQEQDLEMVWED